MHDSGEDGTNDAFWRAFLGIGSEGIGHYRDGGNTRSKGIRRGDGINELLEDDTPEIAKQ